MADSEIVGIIHPDRPLSAPASTATLKAFKATWEPLGWILAEPDQELEEPDTAPDPIEEEEEDDQFSQYSDREVS